MTHSPCNSIGIDISRNNLGIYKECLDTFLSEDTQTPETNKAETMLIKYLRGYAGLMKISLPKGSLKILRINSIQNIIRDRKVPKEPLSYMFTLTTSKYYKQSIAKRNIALIMGYRNRK